MADENLDEDLFADLYDGDDAPPPKAEEIKQEPSPATIVTSQVAPQEPQQQPESVAPAIAVSSDYSMAQNENGNAGPNDAQGWNDGGQAAEPQEDNYGPVGIKEDGKMFIGGLNWETTDESLRNYFSEFGEVLECTVMRDGATGRSRGFGFLTFKDPKTVNTVMVKEHYLDGKIIDPKRAIPREEQERTSKIFVGGVSQEASERDFKEFFMQFGRVIDATLMMDKDTGRPRGFGFVTFDGDEAVDRCLSQPLEIHGKPIEVKRAQPRGNMQEEERGGRFNRRDKFGRGQDNNQLQSQNFDNNQQQQGQGGQQGISQATMAQYWARMQQYFAMMQQQLATNMASQQAQMNPMAGMGGQMNPAMMQQMQQMMAMQQAQQAQQQQGNMGQSPSGTPGPQSPGPQSANMNPQMMQQMQQMMGMQQGGGNGGIPQSGSPVNGGDSAAQAALLNGSDQNMFEQQKYERQQQQRMQQNQQYTQAYSGGGAGAWDGMYDDVPPPNQGGFQRGGGFGGRGRGRGGMQQGGGGPPTGPSNAPANAPTGPKNAGKPFANYRGGGRGGNRGWRPY